MKGNKEVVYTYPDANTVQVVEESANTQTRYARTVYYYASNGTTTVTKKENLTDGMDDPADETTSYTFWGSTDSQGFHKQYVKTVTGPDGTITYNDGCALSVHSPGATRCARDR